MYGLPLRCPERRSVALEAARKVLDVNIAPMWKLQLERLWAHVRHVLRYCLQHQLAHQLLARGGEVQAVAQEGRPPIGVGRLQTHSTGKALRHLGGEASAERCGMARSQSTHKQCTRRQRQPHLPASVSIDPGKAR